MTDFIISELHDGRYVIQTPNHFGGLFPLTRASEDCRSTVECFAKIGEYCLDTGDHYQGVTVTFRRKDHPDNQFTH